MDNVTITLIEVFAVHSLLLILGITTYTIAKRNKK